MREAPALEPHICSTCQARAPLQHRLPACSAREPQGITNAADLALKGNGLLLFSEPGPPNEILAAKETQAMTITAVVDRQQT